MSLNGDTLSDCRSHLSKLGAESEERTVPIDFTLSIDLVYKGGV